MSWTRPRAGGAVLAAALALAAVPGGAQPRSGLDFQSDAIQAMQRDDFQNPGLFWVEQGEALFHRAAGRSGRSCADCHDLPADVAAHYPRVNPRLGRLLSLTGQVQACRVDHQQAAPITHESETALALTAYLGHRARGLPFAPVDASLAPYLDRGEAYYRLRKGQLNLACHHCHEWNAGRYLRGDRISEGHGNGYPGYRLTWETLGSLHRRFRACDLGVRAEPHAPGSAAYTELELFLRHRAGSLPIETPAVRR